jgi:uncharacterized protein
MKLSKFNLWVNNYPKEEEYLLFNTRTQALIKVDKKLNQVLRSISNSYLSYSPPINKNIEVLKENGIIVEDEKEEKDKLDNFFHQLKFDVNSLAYEVTILTTYSCNFRCVYCFEENVKYNAFLDKETSDRIVRWLTQRAEEKNIKRIFVVYYGGEPLLNIKPIYDISWHLNAWAQENGKEFSFGIITNGSLLDKTLVDSFLSVGLKRIRIGLDGDRDAHNKKRPFLDGRPSFDQIVSNIKAVIDKTQISITGNVDRDNLESIPRLLDYLDKEGILYKLKSINFSPIAPRLGPKDNPGAVELSDCLSYFSEQGLFDQTINIKKELLRRGVAFNTGFAINACPMIMAEGGITIDPNGLIYKCNSLLGYPEFSIGNVKKENFNENYEKFLNINAWEKCPEDCPYVPMCQGGCRFYSFLENKDFSGLCCKRKYYDRIAPELIKLEYEKLVTK